MFDRGTEGFSQSRDALARVSEAVAKTPEQRTDTRSAYQQHQSRMMNKWRTAGARNKPAEVK
jgi:hypothetical protein